MKLLWYNLIYYIVYGRFYICYIRKQSAQPITMDLSKGQYREVNVDLQSLIICLFTRSVYHIQMFSFYFTTFTNLSKYHFFILFETMVFILTHHKSIWKTIYISNTFNNCQNCQHRKINSTYFYWINRRTRVDRNERKHL